MIIMGLPRWGATIKNIFAIAGAVKNGFYPGLERSLEEDIAALQYSWQKKSMDREELMTTVHRVAKDWT